MSGNRILFTDGQAATSADIQRLADVAASAEDRVLEVLFTPESSGGTYDKKVLPLLREPPGTTFSRGRTLVYGDPVAAAGQVVVLPAFYVVGNSVAGPDTGDGVISAKKGTAYNVPANSFPSSVTNGYTATVYALVRRIATPEARKIKDPATGNVSTQTINVYSTATVDISVAQGPADGTFNAPTLPADSSTAWYIPLCNIKLDNGSGGAWTQGAAIAQSRITQTWAAGWIKRNRVQLASAASIMSTTYNASANGRASTPLSERWGASISVCAVLQHKSAAAGTYVVFDDQRDWSRRCVTIKAWDIVAAGPTNGTPDQASPIPISSRSTAPAFFWMYFTADKNASRNQIGEWDVDGTGNHRIRFHVNAGVLEVEFFESPSGVAGSGANNYVVMVEATDQFLL